LPAWFKLKAFGLLVKSKQDVYRVKVRLYGDAVYSVTLKSCGLLPAQTLDSDVVWRLTGGAQKTTWYGFLCVCATKVHLALLGWL